VETLAVQRCHRQPRMAANPGSQSRPSQHYMAGVNPGSRRSHLFLLIVAVRMGAA
jgi:hypothetical protein